MGVDVCVYRFRIGLFKGGKFVRKRKGDNYNPYTNSTDLPYRMFVILTFVTCTHSLLWAINNIPKTELVGIETNYTHCRHKITTDYTTNIVAKYVYYFFLRMGN